jgi:hypothetical protein
MMNRRSFVLSDYWWRLAKMVAAREGIGVSALVRKAVIAYLTSVGAQKMLPGPTQNP